MASMTLARCSTEVSSTSPSGFLLQMTDDDDYEDSKKILASKLNKTNRTVSLDSTVQSPTNNNPNRWKHFCSKLKRRLTISKDHHRDRSEDPRANLVERRRSRFRKYTSFSANSEQDQEQATVVNFQWPDFEHIYDTIPSCLINALPGLDDFSNDEEENPSEEEEEDFPCSASDEEDLSPEETMNAFLRCNRGYGFRRNAVCQKLDKIEYGGQLDTFLQQLMIEKLMRTWT